MCREWDPERGRLEAQLLVSSGRPAVALASIPEDFQVRAGVINLWSTSLGTVFNNVIGDLYREEGIPRVEVVKRWDLVQ